MYRSMAATESSFAASYPSCLRRVHINSFSGTPCARMERASLRTASAGSVRLTFPVLCVQRSLASAGGAVGCRKRACRCCIRHSKLVHSVFTRVSPLPTFRPWLGVQPQQPHGFSVASSVVALECVPRDVAAADPSALASTRCLRARLLPSSSGAYRSTPTPRLRSGSTRVLWSAASSALLEPVSFPPPRRCMLMNSLFLAGRRIESAVELSALEEDPP